MWKRIKECASILVFAALLASPGIAHAATRQAPAPSAQEAAIDPEAKDALLRMRDYFKSLPEFAVREDITHEQVIDGDLKVQKLSNADVIVRRPNELQITVTADDGSDHAIYFDGKTLTMYLPASNYFAQMDSPGTIGAALDAADASYGVEFPTPDFLRMVSGLDFANDIIAAGDVGASRVGDTDCEHYAYRTADVDVQLWIQSGDRPIPRRLVITSKKLAGHPEYAATLTWDAAPDIDATTFTFAPPAGAKKILFGAPPRPRGTATPGQ